MPFLCYPKKHYSVGMNMVLIFYLKLRNAENDLDVQMIFCIDEAADLLLETGFKKPLKQLGLSDCERLQTVLLLYHCVLKVKAEMDQFREGLSALGVLTAMENNSSLMKCFFQPQALRISSGISI